YSPGGCYADLVPHFIDMFVLSSVLCIIRLTRRSSLFPYTTLFRSKKLVVVLLKIKIPKTTLQLSTFTNVSKMKKQLVSLGKTRRSEEHTSELQSRFDLVCRPLLEKKKLHSH